MIECKFSIIFVRIIVKQFLFSMFEKINSLKTSSLIVGVVGVLFLGIMMYQFFSMSKSEYEIQIENMRLQKDAQFQRAANSPIKDKKKFKKLDYFPVTEAYRISADFQVSTGIDTFVFRTTKTELRKMLKAGTLSFSLFEHKYQLSAYTSVGKEDNILFIPFKDMTNGVSTYTGGRYLEIPFEKSAKIDLDFNRAFNPYCVYNDTYSCPLPPAENKLSVEIMAGEKMWKE